MELNARLVMSRLIVSGLLLSGPVKASTQACFEASNQDFSEVLACYKKAEDANPLVYTAKPGTIFPGVEKRSFDLSSQRWSPQNLVSPAQWKHSVDIYIPDNPQHGQALLVASNGTPNAGQDNAADPTDFTEAMALEVARKTRTIVISVSNVPNQYLTYADDGIPRTEDASVAHSWKLFLDDPLQRPYMSVRLPMVVSMVKAMDLAQRELQPWAIDRFIATGASKRGWAAWLTAIADERVKAIVPFVIDVLGMNDVLEHTRRAYGGNWPLAFFDYHHEGITRQIKTENFARLMQIEDPLSYLQSRYAERLAIPKYIVNASSDDFFLPDNTQFFYDRLPGPKALRVAPNASHYGISRFVENSLIPVINRWQQGKPLPVITMAAEPHAPVLTMTLHFSEPAVRVVQWTANNPLARDFRHPCGIEYEPQELALTGPLNADMQIDTPENGWNATFVETTFADGFVMTTPVQVTPMLYPTQAPPVIEPACKTLSDEPGR
jgi:PhoPQ-activated pathogenicity-related protein